MTYLEAINKVLRRLREDEVAAPSTSAYSKLIGELVNDANRMVEDAWDWGELRSIRPLSLMTRRSTSLLFCPRRVLKTVRKNWLFRS